MNSDFIMGLHSNHKNNFENENLEFNYYETTSADLQQVVRLGLKNFKFTLDWNQLTTHESGENKAANTKPLHAILDACLENNICPYVTISDGKLPTWLENNGGWSNREIIGHFENFVTFCVNEFSSKIKNWIVFENLTSLTGLDNFITLENKKETNLKYFLPSLNNFLLCQSLCFNKIKLANPAAKVGTTFSYTTIISKSFSSKDIKATERMEYLLNSVFIEATLGKGYPIADLDFFKLSKKFMQIGDEATFKTNLDFVFLKADSSLLIAYNSYIPYLNAKIILSNNLSKKYAIVSDDYYQKSIFSMVRRYISYPINEIIVLENKNYSYLKNHVGANNIKDKIALHQDDLITSLNIQNQTNKVSGFFYSL